MKELKLITWNDFYNDLKESVKKKVRLEIDYQYKGCDFNDSLYTSPDLLKNTDLLYDFVVCTIADDGLEEQEIDISEVRLTSTNPELAPVRII